MQARGALLLGLLLGVAAGCATGESETSRGGLTKLTSFHGPTGSDIVVMEVALLERPIGDKYINKDLWPLADEHVIAMEKRTILEDNGFRVCQVGGITPDGMLGLLTSDRSCVDPRWIQVHAGSPTSLALGPPLNRCRFEIHHDDKRSAVNWEQAKCVLTVVPTLTDDGRTSLHFTPEIQHGKPALMRRPAADLSRWELKEERPAESYPDLDWEVSLAPNEYVVVGARYEKANTLGHVCFIRPEETKPVQRLLVIRTNRSLAGTRETAAGQGEETASFSLSPSLALQASQTALRGSQE